jgi:hypothetical protein
MTRKARNQRSSDTGELKEKIISYFAQPPPRPTDGTSPSCGFNCATYVRLLCPRRHLEDFDRDPMCVHSQPDSILLFSNASVRDFMNKVRTRAIEITADELPTFLYDENMYEEDPDVGLLRGQLLLKVRT